MDDHLLFIEFAYDSSYHACIEVVPFEALYGRRCRFPVGWFEIGEMALIDLHLLLDTMEKVKLISKKLNTTQSCQKSYFDVRKKDVELYIGD